MKLEQNVKDMLDVRSKVKNKKPTFIRQDSLIKRLKDKWVRPRGYQSKLRLNKKGHAKSISKGFKSPVLVKGLLKNGLQPIYVSNLKDLEKLDVKTQAAMINSTVGLKNKLIIIKKAIELKIMVANFKDPAKFIKEKEEAFEMKKKSKQDKEKQKQEKKKQEEKSKKQEKSIDKLAQEEDKSEDEKKTDVKKQQDKVLTSQGEGY
jgi:large subunit ribosomal protein L32e